MSEWDGGHLDRDLRSVYPYEYFLCRGVGFSGFKSLCYALPHEFQRVRMHEIKRFPAVNIFGSVHAKELRSLAVREDQLAACMYVNRIRRKFDERPVALLALSERYFRLFADTYITADAVYFHMSCLLINPEFRVSFHPDNRTILARLRHFENIIFIGGQLAGMKIIQTTA